MFLNYYKLKEQPFGVSPDPRFLYLGETHREALASLVYGTKSDLGFLAMIAEPGMGKTSLLYEYLSQLEEKTRTAFIFRSDFDSKEFIRQVLLDLGMDVTGMDLQQMHDTLNRLLTEEMHSGRRVVLVIDEAQNLEEKTLEFIRLLSNFESLGKKLMLIVLAGQPQLASHLDDPALSQLRQRIPIVIRIKPFTHEEVNTYIDHRLRVAGSQKPSLFTPGARKLIAEHSRGIPRSINTICFNAMSLGYALQRETIDQEIICEVIADLDLAPLKHKSKPITDLDLAPVHHKNEPIADLDLGPVKRPSTGAGKTQEKTKQEGPILFSVGKGKSIVGTKRISRPAIASMLFLLLAGSVQINQGESPAVGAQANAVAPRAISLSPSSSTDTGGRTTEQTRHTAITPAHVGSHHPGVPPDESVSHIGPNPADSVTSSIPRLGGPENIATGDRRPGFLGDEDGTNAAVSFSRTQRTVSGTAKQRPVVSENGNGGEPEVALARNYLRNAGVNNGKISIAAEPEAEKESDQSEQKTEVAIPLTPSMPPAPSGDTRTSSPEFLVMVPLTSSPDGAEINVDDSFVGKAPMTLKLKPGKHAIRMFMNGYHNWSQWITIEPGSEVHVIAVLTKSSE